MGTGLVFGAFCFSDFSFPAQIRQKAVASLHNIAVRRLKISRIPRIRNIAAGTGEGKKFVNLSIRIIFQHPVQIADIRGIHADDVVGALVILPCNLLCVMRHERNVLLAQFIDCPVVRRIADLLAAGGEAVDFKIVGKAEGIYFVGEYALSKSRAEILPWQIKSTLIIKFSCSEIPCNAEFCVGLSAFPGIIFFLVYNYTFYKILQNGAIQSNV